jgi:hypothetical protein
MTEEQIEALIEFVRREATFAEIRAKGMNISPRQVTESSEELRRELREIQKGP